MKSRTATVKQARAYNQGIRAQAAEETGRRIVEAFIERLKTGWFDEITLDEVAGDAGVTVQTVVRRFGGKEGLLEQAVEVFGKQVLATRAAPVGHVEKIVNHLLADYEQTGDLVLRLLASEQRHQSLERFLNIGRAGHRGWVRLAFGDVLEKLPPAKQEALIDRLVIVTDVYTWKLLRRDMKRSLAQAAPVFEALIKSVISGTDHPAV